MEGDPICQRMLGQPVSYGIPSRWNRTSQEQSKSYKVNSLFEWKEGELLPGKGRTTFSMLLLLLPIFALPSPSCTTMLRQKNHQCKQSATLPRHGAASAVRNTDAAHTVGAKEAPILLYSDDEPVVASPSDQPSKDLNLSDYLASETDSHYGASGRVGKCISRECLMRPCLSPCHS